MHHRYNAKITNYIKKIKKIKNTLYKKKKKENEKKFRRNNSRFLLVVPMS